MALPAGIVATSVTAQRRNAVSALFATGKTPHEISLALVSQGFVNPTTGKPYSRQTIRADIREMAKTPNIERARTITRHVSEQIGVWSYTKPNWQARVLLTADTTVRDYVFFDALRRGNAPGLEISGPAFCLPATQKTASYVVGKGIKARLVESAISEKTVKTSSISEVNGKPTQDKLNSVKSGLSIVPKAKPNPNANDRVAWTNLQIAHFMERNQGFLLPMIIDLYGLGDQYVIVNPDCTLSIASPETVTIEYSASDYRRVLSVIIRTRMQGARVEDIYTPDKRIIATHYYDERGTVTQEYENLIGRIPIIHFANDRSANEIFGRPIYAGGLPIMYRYDALINNILEGVTLLGTPIPMFTGLDNPTETKLVNSEAVNYIDEEGNQQTQYVTRLDRQTGLYIGKGGDGKMLSTNVGFTKDSLDSLRQLFLLWLNQTHIPEFIWGGAIASSKASADSQMPPFIQFINSRRLMLEGQGADPALNIDAQGGLLELIDIWLRTYKLLNPDIVVGPVEVEWPEIDIPNDQLKYMYTTYFNGTGKITDETALRMSGYVSDPAAEVMKAAGKKVRPPQFDDYEAKLQKARLQTAQKDSKPGDDDGLPFTSDYVALEPALIEKGYSLAGATGVSLARPPRSDMSGDEWDMAGPFEWFGQLGGHGG